MSERKRIRKEKGGRCLTHCKHGICYFLLCVVRKHGLCEVVQTMNIISLPIIHG